VDEFYSFSDFGGYRGCAPYSPGVTGAERRPRGQAPWEIKNAFRLNADAIESAFFIIKEITVLQGCG